MPGMAATPDPASDVFTNASKALEAYSQTATANLGQLSIEPPDLRRLLKFDVQAVATALQSTDSGETLHHLLYAGVAGQQLAPVSLNMLWAIHINVVYLDAMVALQKPPLARDELVDRYRLVVADSELLAEVFAHVARVSRAGLGGQVYDLLRSGKADNPDSVYAALLELCSLHRRNIQVIAARLRSAFANSGAVASVLAAFKPVDLPLWTAVKDHPGARVINNVWFPKEFADSLMQSLATEQAKAMAPAPG
jgi:hypothetical protein